MGVWLMLGNEGMDKDRNGSFCAHTPSAIVFGRSDGDRMAVTRDLSLRPGYTLQFKVCCQTPSFPYRGNLMYFCLLSSIVDITSTAIEGAFFYSRGAQFCSCRSTALQSSAPRTPEAVNQGFLYYLEKKQYSRSPGVGLAPLICSF